MRISIIWALPASILMSASTASAREADLLDFTAIPIVSAPASAAESQGPALEGLGRNPFADFALIQGGVSEAMRDAFVQHGLQRGEPEVAAPRWLRRRGIGMLCDAVPF